MLLKRTSAIVFVRLALAIVILLWAGAAQATHITLDSTPSPPAMVPNDGTSQERFDWTIEWDTNCCQPFTFEILDNTLALVDGPFFFPCTPSPYVDTFFWTVPAGLECGGYHGRVRLFTDWLAPAIPCSMQDEALVSFIVGGGARVRFCKYLDIDGDGNKDPEDPPLSGWTFTITGPTLPGPTVTDPTGVDGCTPFIILPVNCFGTTDFDVVENPPGGVNGWERTKPLPRGSPSTPFQITVEEGEELTVVCLNWQPVSICGFKFLDQAPWPWSSPHWVGPDGQQNNPVCNGACCLEPAPSCPQPAPPAACVSPTQHCDDPLLVATGLGNVTVRLYDNTDPFNPILLATTSTAADGSFCFGPLQWREELKIEVDDPAPSPPTCQPPLDCGLLAWAGTYYGTVATSVWPCPNIDFANPHVLELTLTGPVAVNQVYGCNYFFNRQPSRLWGKFCEDWELVTDPTLGVGKDGFPWIPDTVVPDMDGCYEVPPLAVEPEGLRPGVFRLTPPPVPDPTTQFWEVHTYCDSINGTSVFPLPGSGYVDVGVGHSADVRVDFCLKTQGQRRCFLPVTFTQQGWHDFCDPANPIIPGGMVYNRFPIAFANFTYYSTTYNNKVIIGLGPSTGSGQGKTITWDGTSVGLARLCLFLPQTGTCAKLNTSYLNPWTLPVGVGGALAGELLALQMNIAYNDMRLMPRTAGYDLEKFVIADGLLKGRTVRDARNMANAVLGGALPQSVGLPAGQAGYDALCAILAAINANYEFVNFNVYNDRGFLIPNRAFGQPDPPVAPTVP